MEKQLKLNYKRTLIIGFAFFSILMVWQAYNFYCPLFLNTLLFDILQEKNATYAAKGGDNERFLSMVNDYLIRARYPVLYAGDPYDWIFMYCNETESPLHIFRQYMHELYILKEDEFDYK